MTPCHSPSHCCSSRCRSHSSRSSSHRSCNSNYPGMVDCSAGKSVRLELHVLANELTLGQERRVSRGSCVGNDELS